MNKKEKYTLITMSEGDITTVSAFNKKMSKDELALYIKSDIPKFIYYFNLIFSIVEDRIQYNHYNDDNDETTIQFKFYNTIKNKINNIGNFISPLAKNKFVQNEIHEFVSLLTTNELFDMLYFDGKGSNAYFNAIRLIKIDNVF